MALPLILLIALLVVLSRHLCGPSRDAEQVDGAVLGFGNFPGDLFTRQTFWMVVRQSCVFAVTAVLFKALIGFIVAHFVHTIV